MQTKLLQTLARINDPGVDLALAAALPTADGADLPRLADVISSRPNDEAKTALLHQYSRLPARVRQGITGNIRQYYSPLRRAAQARQSPTPGHVIQIILEASETRLAYLVVELLVHGDQPHRVQAAACLLDLARHWQQRILPNASHAADTADYLQQAIEQAVSVYESHRQTDVLRALMALAPRRVPGAWAALETAPQSKALLVDCRSLLTHADSPVVCAALLAWVTHPKLGSDALAGLAAAAGNGSLGHVLTNAHLLLDARTRATLVRLKGKADVFSSSTLSSDAEGPCHYLPAWIVALPLASEQKVARLAALASAPERQTRLAALRRLMALPAETCPDAREGIARFCDDPHEAIARIAYRHLSRCAAQASPAESVAGEFNMPLLLLRLVNSPHESLRQLAGRRIAAMGYERFWNAWPQLTAGQRLAAGRALIKLDPGFHQHVGKALADADNGMRLRALAIIHGLNQGELFESALLALAGNADSRVASAAVRALGTVPSAEAILALKRALNHPDSRVRANAIEALQQARAGANVQRLAAMAQEDESRPRANAIGVLLDMRAAEALTALRAMLADSRANHRASALWLVESMGLLELATHVAELAVSDRDRDIKARAQRVVRRILGIMQGTAEPASAPQPTLTAA